ncbi:hypothetical protein DRJ19_05175 [Candidatus Woesearchaeota archaeon]|nr:MAG: hypothetical protein DRJ19_05175 [Candidatus Woesearchaeota archaeon]
MSLKIAIAGTTAIETPPKGYGGIELLVYGLVRELEKLGHRVTLYAKEGSYEPNGGLVVCGSESDIAKQLFEDRDSYDIIHDWSHTKLASRLLGRMGYRVFSTPFWTDERGFNPIYPSKAVAYAFGSISPIVYPGIPVEGYELVEDKEDYYIYFGRIAPIKGVDRTIFLARKAGVRLKVVGHVGWGAYDKVYIQYIKSLCRDGIEWVGEVSHEEKLELLGHAKAMIFTPLWLESYGITVTESLLLGTPVIVSGVGGHLEQVIHGVCGYHLTRPDEIYDAIRVVERLDYRKVRERGLYFSSERMTRDYLKIYGEKYDLL